MQKQDDIPWRGTRLGGDMEGKEDGWRSDLEKAFRMGRPHRLHPVVFLQFQLRRSGEGSRKMDMKLGRQGLEWGPSFKR